MRLIINDIELKESMRPFSATKHVANIRLGFFSIFEKWKLLSGVDVLLVSGKHDFVEGDVEIPCSYIPTAEDYLQIIESCKTKETLPPEFRLLKYPWDFVKNNEWAIRRDYDILMNSISTTKSNLFKEQSSVIGNCIINTSDGPVYIGKNAMVMDGAVIKGPAAICEGAVVKMGSKIYPGTTVGRFSSAGGEIKNSIIGDFSNKSHDGYMGDSIIGEWCNIGAGTEISNVKNSGGDVFYESPYFSEKINVGKKAGLIMGDYSRLAINSSVNTATIIGVCCNYFSRELTPKFIPDFSWGDQKYDFAKAIEDINNWKKFKDGALSESETQTLQSLYYKTFDNA